jgi:hypothetical protein
MGGQGSVTLHQVYTSLHRLPQYKICKQCTSIWINCVKQFKEYFTS